MNIKDFVAQRFTTNSLLVDELMETALTRILQSHSPRCRVAYLVPPENVALQTACDWLEARGWVVSTGPAPSGHQFVILSVSDSVDQQVRRERDAVSAPAPAPVVDRRPPWERSLPLPANAPACVVEARNRWYFDCGIYAPLEVLMKAYWSEGTGTLGQMGYSLYMAEALEDWEDSSEAEDFKIVRQPNHLTGIDAFLACVLPGRCDDYDIVLCDRADSFALVCLKAAFGSLGAYIREMYPKVGDTRNAREDGLDYRVLASLAEHGVDPTDDDRDPELAVQWAACQKDTLVLGSFYALQRVGEFINNLFPEKAGEGEE